MVVVGLKNRREVGQNRWELHARLRGGGVERIPLFDIIILIYSCFNL